MKLAETARRRLAPRSLSLMTFNLLAPCYFRHGGLLESSNPPAFLARAQAAIAAIKRERCDLVCLQEYWFEREYQQAFRQAFHPTHYLHHVKRPGDKEDGLAVFVDKRKLEIHYVENVAFDPAHAGDRVALLMHVATKWNRDSTPLAQRSFLVLNSHLTFPHNSMYTSLRLNQIDRVLTAARKYLAREDLHDLPVLLCGDFNDYDDPVYRSVAKHGFSSMFAEAHGREARITHCNHNNHEVGVDFIFGARLQHNPSADTDAKANGTAGTIHGQNETRSQLQLAPAGCHLVPERLPDVVRLKRPKFGQDWRNVQTPTLLMDEEALVDYWRLVSDHRPLVARFDVFDSHSDEEENEHKNAASSAVEAELSADVPVEEALNGVSS